MALQEHVERELQNIKERYIQIVGLIARSNDPQEIEKLQEEKANIQTIVESYQALDAIEKDMETFEAVLSDPDPEENRLDEKDTAKVFIREFEQCRVAIEDQLTNFVEKQQQ